MGKGTAYFEKKKSYMYWKKKMEKNMQILFFLYGWNKKKQKIMKLLKQQQTMRKWSDKPKTENSWKTL